MELNDFQKRIEGLFNKTDNETQKMILRALVLEFESGVIKELCMSLISDAGNEEVRNRVIRSCASCLGGVSMLASNIGMSLEEIANVEIDAFINRED